jgi:hypothetical protein
MDPATELSSTEARDVLSYWLQEHPDFHSFLARKGLRLPETQRQALLRILQAAQATDYASALEPWTTHTALSLRTRALAMRVLDSLGRASDTSYKSALGHAESLLEDLQSCDPVPLTEAGDLQAPWNEKVLNLPLALARDLARELTVEAPQCALALLRTLRPIADAKDRLALVDSLASIPLVESAAILHDILADTTDKAAQKAIKKALHRLKASGVAVQEVQQKSRATVGTVRYRLEQCLASHIDSAGDRIIWLIRTKSFGGYHIAYLAINYGTGIQFAAALPASKRDLPELLGRAQEQSQSPLIELDPDYCQFQVARAYQMNLDTGTPVPEGFFAVRDIVGETDMTFEKAMIYTALSEADLQESEAYTHHASTLQDLPQIAGWQLPNSIIQKYADELRNLEESQIVVSEVTQRQRVSAIYEQAAEEALGEQSRYIMRLRLEEMAYYLLQTDRRLQALWAVAAARSLEDSDPERLRRNPFAGALVERSLESAKRHPSSHIILPFSPPAASASQPAREEGSRIII